jgi:hypothetical protein
MSRTSGMFLCCMAMVAVTMPVSAADSLSADTQATVSVPGSAVIFNTTARKIEISGTVGMENGQFVKSNYKEQIQPNRIWINREYVQLGLKATLGDHFQVIMVPEVKLWYDTYTWQTMGNQAFANPFIQHSTVSLADAEGILNFGNPDRIGLQCAAGVIPYKYDENAKNFGEYLFRTGARPCYILTSFDYAFARVTGVRVNSIIMRNLSMDLFLSTETQVPPTLDWSVSFLVGYKIPALVDAGIGVMFERLMPVDKSVERPVTSDNLYLTSTGEKKYFSFGGTKLMARASFDMKGVLPSSASRIFGKQDAILYGEASVLGLENTTPYTWFKANPVDTDSVLVVDSSKNYFSNIRQRIPIMFGFNIPTFNVLDFLSVELEYYPWPYPNSFGEFSDFKVMNPLPTKIQSFDKQVYKDDDWKYSFNVKKTVTKGFAVIGQISRDHSHHDTYYHTYDDETEVFSQKDEWGWWLKLQYNF